MTLSQAIAQSAVMDEAALAPFIESALEIEVADAFKEWISRSAYMNVYFSYTPKFYSRRYRDGGMADVSNMDAHASGNSLTVTDNAGWQQLYGGARPGQSLASALEEGNPRYHFGNAGPRPFYDEAKSMFIGSGEAEAALRAGLARQGIDTTGMTFQFF